MRCVNTHGADLSESQSRAMWLLQMSVRAARAQSAEYEALQSEILLNRIRVELGYPDAATAAEQIEQRLGAFRTEQLPQRIYSSLSLVDRFDSLLESGRQIASGMDPGFILQSVAEAGKRLLRSNYSDIVLTDDHGQPLTLSEGIRENAIAALRTHDAVCASGVSSDLRSLLVCPIIVRSRPVACLVVGIRKFETCLGSMNCVLPAISQPLRVLLLKCRRLQEPPGTE